MLFLALSLLLFCVGLFGLLCLFGLGLSWCLSLSCLYDMCVVGLVVLGVCSYVDVVRAVFLFLCLYCISLLLVLFCLFVV